MQQAASSLAPMPGVRFRSMSAFSGATWRLLSPFGFQRTCLSCSSAGASGILLPRIQLGVMLLPGHFHRNAQRSIIHGSPMHHLRIIRLEARGNPREVPRKPAKSRGSSDRSEEATARWPAGGRTATRAADAPGTPWRRRTPGIRLPGLAASGQTGTCAPRSGGRAAVNRCSRSCHPGLFGEPGPVRPPPRSVDLCHRLAARRALPAVPVRPARLAGPGAAAVRLGLARHDAADERPQPAPMHWPGPPWRVPSGVLAAPLRPARTGGTRSPAGCGTE